MDKDEIRNEELKGMCDRLQQEVDLLHQIVNANQDQIEYDYAIRTSRSQIRTIREVARSIDFHIGDGDIESLSSLPNNETHDEE
jgi:hypothetical protein